MDSLDTRVSRLLGVRYPHVQAAIGWIARSQQYVRIVSRCQSCDTQETAPRGIVVSKHVTLLGIDNAFGQKPRPAGNKQK